MKYIVILLIIFTDFICFSQNAVITYTSTFNGTKMEDVPDIKLIYKDNTAIFYNDIKEVNEISWFDYNEKKTYQSVLNKDAVRYTTIEKFENYLLPQITNETAQILGYKCTKAKVVIRSNFIDIWFTNEAGIKGSPAINIGPELGLVLKVVRNGNYIIEATDITKNTESTVNIPADPGNIIDLAEYRYRVTENNYSVISVFENERLNFGDTIVSEEPIIENKTFRYSKGTVILKKIKLPEKVSGQTIFAELTEYSDGDAYDRTGSLFIIPVNYKNNFIKALTDGVSELPVTNSSSGKNYQGIKLEKDYEPPIEVIRFMTPFGINKYNDQVKVFRLNWHDSVMYKMDVTDLAGVLKGETYIGSYISNFDKGGHIISLKLKYHPDDVYNTATQEKNFWIKPLINTLNLLEMSGQEYGSIFGSDTLKVQFEVPDGIKDLKLRYITSGHGGWGNGDEFNKRMNEIFIDDNLVYKFIPWRTDCGTYREYNPASGNFINGISSSDFSRSNWCPGQSVIPEEIPLDNISAGKHTISVFIPMGKPEGSSFSSWSVSAVLIGEKSN